MIPKNHKNSFLRNSLIGLYTLIILCLFTIIVEMVDNYNYSKNGIETQGKVVGFVSKKGNVNSTHRTVTDYPIIKYRTSANDSACFTSTYTYNKADINETIAVTFIPQKLDKVRIDTFSIHWFFSIFATIIMLVCSVFIVVIRSILKFYKKKEEYLKSLSGKTMATVVEIEKAETGWNLLLTGNIPEQDNRRYTFTHFTFFDSANLLGQSFEVRYDPTDIEHSYIFNIEHSS